MMRPESRFRRFARAVTTEVGALDESFLGRGRPLGAARVLNAVGRGISDVADLRSYLRLDSGLMSRLLRSLEHEGLIRVHAGKDDARRRVVYLTATGEKEVAAYENLSDERARALLDRYGDPKRLLLALDLVATALTMDQIHIDVVPVTDEAARYCLECYYRELDERFDDGFDVARSRDPAPERVSAPMGAFLVAVSDDLPLGCVALVGDGSATAEIKRLWVSSSARGCGVGRLLMAEVEKVASELGIRRLRLDTNRALTEAASFYRRAGWSELERFNDDPYADFFFEKTLDAGSSSDARRMDKECD